MACCCLLASGAARAELTVTPLRQVLDADRRVATFEISNPSRRILEGRVGWIDLAATPTGYEPATPEQRGKLSAAPNLTVWPAFFRLEPGKRTTVTVALRKNARLERGERRSHLLIETGAVRTPLRKAGGALELDIGLGVSTPVIVRHGDGEARARIAQTRLLRTAEGYLEIEIAIEPGGDFSAFGRIDVMLTERGGKTAKRIARAENIAAWPDAQARRYTIPLHVERLPASMLEIVYVGRAEYEGVVFASKAFEVAPSE